MQCVCQGCGAWVSLFKPKGKPPTMTNQPSLVGGVAATATKAQSQKVDPVMAFGTALKVAVDPAVKVIREQQLAQAKQAVPQPAAASPNADEVLRKAAGAWRDA
eukprot:2113505-Pyramimonas_sp.AAC.1